MSELGLPPPLSKRERALLPPRLRELLRRRDRDGVEAACSWYAGLPAEERLAIRADVVRFIVDVSKDQHARADVARVRYLTRSSSSRRHARAATAP